MIALKGNQGKLHETIKDSFELAEQGSKRLTVYVTEDEINGDHGRLGERKIEVILAAELTGHIDAHRQQLNSLICITYTRSLPTETLMERRYYISSLAPNSPQDILNTIRAHWQVEYCLHWSLDVTFREDNHRIRDERTATNLSWLRNFCLGLLKRQASFRQVSGVNSVKFVPALNISPRLLLKFRCVYPGVNS